MSRNQILLVVLGGVLIVFGIPLTLYLVSQQQDPRSRASDVVYPDDVGFSPQQPTQPPQVQQTCTAPLSPSNTDITYPHTSSDGLVVYEEANCTWDTVEGASAYRLKITDVDSGQVVREEEVIPSTTLAVFPIVQGTTYLCEVASVNDCGSVSAVSSDQQVCETDALISPSPTDPPSPTPTTPIVDTPTPTPSPADAPTPTDVVKPPPPATGTTETLLVGGGIAAVIIAFGAALLIW